MSYLNEDLNNSYYEFIDFANLNDDEKTMVWQWRNHESIRQWMNNKDVIKIEDHLIFLNDLKSDTTKKYWVIKRKNKYIGVYSIVNLKDKIGEGGYYIAPELHNYNLGVEFCYFTFNFLFDIFGIQKIYGYALKNNKGANSLSKLLGFSRQIATKIIDGSYFDYYYGELTVEKWNNEIKDDKRIKKLLSYTLNKI